ncbi:MAG: type I-E CRISPR-associated protein Cas6/Cse3/CasE [Deltaproteobacteria bacterium]|nr:type I-E CRISPR-associated protein Cas6/Cse3/CasE [Deltaproteobacteria bacterium]
MRDGYLSKVTLSPRRGEHAWMKLRDLYDVHQAIWAAFAGGEPGAQAPFLFRADPVREGDVMVMRALVQSVRVPDWAALGDSVTSVEGPKSRDDAWWDAHAQKGAVLRFFLRANTTQSVRDGHGDDPKPLVPGGPRTRGKRVALEGEQAQLDWFARRAAGCGFALCQREIVVKRRDGSVLSAHHEPELRTSNVRVWRWAAGEGKRFASHQGVDFEGLLEVTDQALLRRAVQDGIGPAKSMGFGMLSLARHVG